MRKRYFLILLSLGLSCGTLARATVEFILVPSESEVSAGSPFEVSLLVTNSGAQTEALTAPATLVLVGQHPEGLHELRLRAADEMTEAFALSAGAFKKIVYRGIMPETVSGMVSLGAPGAPYGRAFVSVIPVESGDDALANDVRDEAAETDVDLPNSDEAGRLRDLGILAYEPVYFSLGFRDGMNARFQFSFKFRPFGPNDTRIYADRFIGNLYFSYTQTSIWDLDAPSKPFFDTAYQPSLFYAKPDGLGSLFGARAGYAAGYRHESNGQDGDLSRSIDTVFIQPRLTWENRGGWRFVLNPRIYAYLEKSDNRDIQRFRGYGDYIASIEHPDHWKLSTVARLGTSGKGSVLIDFAYPLRKLINLGKDTNGNLHLQYFYGYGESLRTFDERLPWQIRLGFMIVR